MIQCIIEIFQVEIDKNLIEKEEKDYILKKITYENVTEVIFIQEIQ